MIDEALGEGVSKPKGTECTGCGIMVGNGYMEIELHQVGNYHICGWCRRQLAKWGHLLIQPYNQHQYLYLNDRVVIKKAGGKDSDNHYVRKEDQENLPRALQAGPG